MSCGTYLSLTKDLFVTFVNHKIKCLKCYEANAEVKYEPDSKSFSV